MAGVKSYDPSEVQIILGGAVIGGYADGTFVELAPNSDRYNDAVGCDGEIARAKTNDRTMAMTLTLMQTSSSNDVLSGLMVADELNNGGAVPLLIKEMGSGRTLAAAEAAWVKTPPTISYDKSIGDRQWTVRTSNVALFVGGNSDSAGN